MLIEIETSDFSYVIKLNEEVINYFKQSLPFNTELHVWKEEVYFETPVKIPKKPDVISIELGKVYYWPPGKALCLFYGISEPYTPLIQVGEFVGILDYLRKIGEGIKATVKIHEIDKELRDQVRTLSKLGYNVATPLINGERSILASKFINDIRLAFVVYIEEYGLHIESEPLYNYSRDLRTVAYTKKLKSIIRKIAKYSRVDLSEDMKVCITAVANEINELPNVVRDVEKVFTVAHKITHGIFS